MIMGTVLLLLVLGGFLIVSPETVWVITESWKTEHATEPSQFYIITTRISGILLVILAVFVMYVSTW